MRRETVVPDGVPMRVPRWSAAPFVDCTLCATNAPPPADASDSTIVCLSVTPFGPVLQPASLPFGQASLASLPQIPWQSASGLDVLPPLLLLPHPATNVIVRAAARCPSAIFILGLDGHRTQRMRPAQIASRGTRSTH